MRFGQIILIVLIILITLISGCTSGQDITPVVKTIPEVQQFLKEHPNAKITVTYWSKEDITKSISEISSQCDKPIPPAAMYKATISEGDLRSIAWIDAQNQTPICTIIEGQGETPTPTITPSPTATPEITSTPEGTSTPRVTETPEITSTPEVTHTQTATRDSFELKNDYRLRLAKVEGMNEIRSPDGTLKISKGTNVIILIQLFREGKIVDEQTVTEGAAFNLHDNGKLIVKANFRSILVGVETYMVNLENLIQYDKGKEEVKFTMDRVSLLISHPQ